MINQFLFQQKTYNTMNDIYQQVKSLANNADFMKAGCVTGYSGTISGEKIYTREFDELRTTEIRMNDYMQSEFVQQSLGVVIDDAKILDGKKFHITEGFTVETRSRATGHRGKLECGWNAGDVGYFSRKVATDTELIDASVEMCPNKLIGTEFQDRLMGGSSISEILNGAPQPLVDRVFDTQSRFKTLTIDVNNVLGDTGAVSKVRTSVGRQTNVNHHYDGVLKQIYLAESGQYYATKEWDLSGHTSEGVTIWHGGQYAYVSDAATATAVTFIEGLKDMGSADEYFTVEVPSTGKIVVTSNNPSMDVQLDIYPGEVNDRRDCPSPISFTRLQKPMVQSDSPVSFAFEQLNKDNAIDFFVELFVKIATSFELEFSDNPNIGFYLAYDPLWDVYRRAALLILKKDENKGGVWSAISERVRMVPYKHLRNTNLFYGTFTANVAFLTNSVRGDLGVIEMWRERKEETLCWKNKMVANVKVLLFGQTISNIGGYVDAKGYQFQPAYTPYETAGESPFERLNTASSEDARARAYISIATAGDPAVQTITFTAKDILPKGVSVSAYDWKFYMSDGSVVASTSGPSATFDGAGALTLSSVRYEATYSDGKSDVVFLPITEFEFVEGN